MEKESTKKVYDWPEVQEKAYQEILNRFGQDVFRDLQELQIGISTTAFRVDQSGIWLGGNLFSEATFSVDMDGNVLAKSFRTGDTGQHIEIDSANTNQIRFYDNTTLFGLLEVDYDAGTNIGYINLLAQDENAGLSIDVGIGASAYSSVELFANGGSFGSSGNATNHYLTMAGVYAGILQLRSEFGGSDEEVYTDLDFTTDGLISLAEMTEATADARPFLKDGSMFYDSATDEAKIRIAGAWVVFAA